MRNVAYLFDQTPYYRPWLSWIGVDLRRVGIDDLVRDAQRMRGRALSSAVSCSGQHSKR